MSICVSYDDDDDDDDNEDDDDDPATNILQMRKLKCREAKLFA